MYTFDFDNSGYLSLPSIFFTFTSLSLSVYLPSGERFLLFSKLSGLFISIAVPPVTGIMYDLRLLLFASTSGVLTEYKIYFPSLETPSPFTLPNFHSNSGVITPWPAG